MFVFKYIQSPDKQNCSKSCFDTRKSRTWLSVHAPHTSAPTKALDEADDAGLAPAHGHPVHGGNGVTPCPALSRIKTKNSLVRSTTQVHDLSLSWLSPPGHSFHGCSEPKAGVCFKKKRKKSGSRVCQISHTRFASVLLRLLWLRWCRHRVKVRQEFLAEAWQHGGLQHAMEA